MKFFIALGITAQNAMVVLALLVGVGNLSATTLSVGTCRTGSYSTIQAAINAAPFGATVQVCPGTYNEQLSISQSLILQGITALNGDVVTIAVPSGGLIITTDDLDGRQVAPQVLVKNSSGPVTISNIAVDGTNNGWAGACPPLLAGIFYQNSSGTISRVTTRYQDGNGCGNGIWVEGGQSNPSVTVQGSFINFFDLYGINTETYFQPPTELTVKVTGNNVWGSEQSNGAGIYIDQGSTATVTGNDVLAQASTPYGILIWVNSKGSVSSNSVQQTTTGISLHSDGVSVSSNKLLLVRTGIDVQTSIGAVKSNNIVTFGINGFGVVPGIGIEFNCKANPNVLSNSISNGTLQVPGIGVDHVPSGLSTPNSYFFVGQIRTGGC